MKTPQCVRALWRAFGLTAVVCLFTGAGHAQQFTGYDLIVPRGATPNEITTVDGATATLPTGRSFVIGIEGGLRNPILFTNWTGSADYPIMIVNVPGAGRVNISDLVPGNPSAPRATGIKMVNCKYVKLRGDNDPAYRYGIEISRAGGRTSGAGQRGVDVTGKSSYVEISHLEIHDIAFAGIMVKQDPTNNPAEYQDFNHPYLVYYDIKVHDNYIYNVGGEGMYIGYSKWTDNRGGQGLEFCHNIIGLRVYNNLLEDCWWDGIQVGAATEDAAIYNNTILRSGASTSTESGNTGKGIQIGEGTTGLCYNNIVVDSRGNGIALTGYGNNYVYNNLIIRGTNGVFADSRPDTEVPIPPSQPADRQTQPGSAYYVYHNTVINPSLRAFHQSSDVTDNLFHNNLAVVAVKDPPTDEPFVYWEHGTGTELGNHFQTTETGLDFASANRLTDFDYRILTTSAARNKGVTGVEIPDFFQVARPANGPSDAGYAESEGFSVFLRVTAPTSGNNGAIDAAALNGTTPYTYLWSDGNTGNPRTGLAPGYYSVVVTDAAGLKQRRATYLFTGATAGAPVSFTPLTQVETQTFTAPSGTYGTAQSVTIATATPGATIRYTTNGTTPTMANGTTYTGGTVAVGSTGTLKAYAYKSGLTDSAVSVATYFIGVAPAAPVLTAAVSDRKIVLNWTAPSGANRYELKYATTSGGPYTTLGTITANTFTHGGLTNGTTYSYVVQASNIYGTSPSSAQVSATPFPYVGTLSILGGLSAGPTTDNGAPAAGAFTSQPTWDNVNLTPFGNDAVPGSTTGTNSVSKFWAIDFGTGFGSYHIVEMWTRYNPNSSGAKPGFASMWWDNDIDSTNDGTTASPAMNFQNGTVPNSNSVQYWVRDREFPTAPITPLDRYLVVSIGTATTNKPNEFAFVGWQDGAAAAPAFTQHPKSQTAAPGSTVYLTATATGSPMPAFQWKKSGLDIPGATGQVLTLTNVQASDAASYYVTATNASGSATSNSAVLTVSGGAPTLVILTPSAVGTASGSAACSAIGAFNEQPTWDAVNGVPVGIAASPHTPTSTAYSNRTWFIDFGVNYANIRITQMWTRYRPNSSGNHPGFGQLWWDNDNDNVNDGTTASTMNFGNGQGLPNVSNQLWVRDRDFTSAPITPLNRYLVIYTGATTPSDRPNEFAFVGYTVP